MAGARARVGATVRLKAPRRFGGSLVQVRQVVRFPRRAYIVYRDQVHVRPGAISCRPPCPARHAADRTRRQRVETEGVSDVASLDIEGSVVHCDLYVEGYVRVYTTDSI